MLLIKIPHFCGGSILTGLNTLRISETKQDGIDPEYFHYKTWMDLNLKLSKEWDERNNRDIGFGGPHSMCPDDKVLFLKSFITLIKNTPNYRPLIHSYLHPKGYGDTAYKMMEEIGFKKVHSYRNPKSGNVMDMLVFDVREVVGNYSEYSLEQYLKKLIQEEEEKAKPKTIATKLKTRFSKNDE